MWKKLGEVWAREPLFFFIEGCIVGQLYPDENDSVEIENGMILGGIIYFQSTVGNYVIGGVALGRACRSSSCHSDSTSSKRLFLIYSVR